MGPYLCIRNVLRLFFLKSPVATYLRKVADCRPCCGHAGQNMFEKDFWNQTGKFRCCVIIMPFGVFFFILVGSDRLYLHMCCTGYISGCRTFATDTQNGFR